MARRTITYYEELVVPTVDAMPLPSWYTRQEGYSTGYLAVELKAGKYRKSMRCSIQTYLRNAIRWAVKDELRKFRRWRQREPFMEDLFHGDS